MYVLPVISENDSDFTPMTFMRIYIFTNAAKEIESKYFS